MIGGVRGVIISVPPFIFGSNMTIKPGDTVTLGGIMKKYVFDELSIEITRRCNKACQHCMLGDA